MPFQPTRSRHASWRSLSTLAAVFALLVLQTSAALAQFLTFNATYFGATPTAQADAFVTQALTRLGGNFLTPNANPFALNVSVTWSSLGGGALGRAGASQYLEVNNIAYGQGLFRYLGVNNPVFTVSDPNDLEPFDLEIELNRDADWDYTFATPLNTNQFSLASVLFHEGFHGLDFISVIGASGEYPFDFGTGGIPNIFSTFLESAAGTRLDTLTDFGRRLAVTGGDNALFFGGTNARAALGGARPEMYAPSGFEPGSSGGSHTSDDGQTYAELMRPFIENGRYIEPGNVELAMMRDIGWLTVPANVPEMSSLLLVLAVGVPFASVVVLRRHRRSTTLV